LSLVRRAYEDRQHESGYRLNDWEQNPRAYGTALLQRNTDASISYERSGAGISVRQASTAVLGSQQMASNATGQASQSSREESSVSSCSQQMHPVIKRRTRNREEDLQALIKSKKAYPEDVIDLTHVKELEPLDFKEEESKLARTLESLKTRYPKPGYIMYRYFLISIALVEKCIVGTEHGVYDENYNVDGEKDEECFFCSQQLRGKVIGHRCQCGHWHRAHIECFRCNLANRLNGLKEPESVCCLVCHNSLFKNNPVLRTI